MNINSHFQIKPPSPLLLPLLVFIVLIEFFSFYSFIMPSEVITVLMFISFIIYSNRVMLASTARNSFLKSHILFDTIFSSISIALSFEVRIDVMLTQAN